MQRPRIQILLGVVVLAGDLAAALTSHSTIALVGGVALVLGGLIFAVD